MLTRRQIDCGFAASFSLGGLRIATTLTWAQASFQNDPLPKLQSGGDGPDAGLKIYAGALTGKLLTDGDSLPAQSKGLSPQGVGEPKSEEKTLGRKIVTEAPIRCRPFDVAEYFRPQNLVNKFGKAAEEYARGWPADRPYQSADF